MDSSDLLPPHPARIPIDDLVASMVEEGWRGRALIVAHIDGEYRALTGSHRIAAAREAGLVSIPCHVLELPKRSAWARDVLDANNDVELRRAILKSRDEVAIQLMAMER